MTTENEIDARTRSRAALEWARQLEKTEKTDPSTANETLVAFQINELLESIDLKEILEKVESGSKEYLELVRTILDQCAERTKRMKVELELQMYKQTVKEQTHTMQEVLHGEPGLSPETLRALEAAMAKL